MAQGQGLADEDVAVAVVGVVVQVAAAEAGAVDCDLDFICRGGGEVARFLMVISIPSFDSAVFSIASSGLSYGIECGDSQCGGLLRRAEHWLGLVSTT